MSTTRELDAAQPGRQKRILRPLTDIQWRQARAMFEAGGLEITHADIAKAFDTSLSMVQKRCAAEKWAKAAQLVVDARRHLAKATDSALAVAADSAAKQMAERITKELQPWIEKEKTAHIKRAMKRSKRAFKRLSRVSKGFQVYDAKRGELVDCEPGPKDEMHIATAEDKWDGIVRRTLGMSDSGGLSGSLSLNILTGSAAIQVNATPAEPS